MHDRAGSALSGVSSGSARQLREHVGLGSPKAAAGGQPLLAVKWSSNNALKAYADVKGFEKGYFFS